YFGKFELMLLDGAVANLTISCIVREFAVTDVPELSGIELVKEAMSLDISSYANTENFVAALNAAKEFYAEKLMAENLKAAWKAMYKTETLLYPNIQKISGTNTAADSINKTADGLVAALPAGITEQELGEYYSYHSGVYSTTGTGENRFMWFNATVPTVNYANINIKAYDDLSLSFYVEDVAQSGSIMVNLLGNSGANLSGKGLAIDETSEGKWITLDAEDMVSGGMEAIKASDVGKNKLTFYQWLLGSNKVKFKGWFGSLIGKKSAAPQNIDEMTEEELILAALTFDTTGYENAEEFKALVAEIAQEYADVLAISQLKSAWNGMYNIENLLVPAIQKVSDANMLADGYYSTADGLVAALPAGITVKDLGGYYSYHSGVNNTTGTGENRFIWSKNASSATMLYSNVNLSDYSDLKLSFYIDDIATEGSFDIKLYSNTLQVFRKIITITEADKGKWFVFDAEDLTGSSMDNIKETFGSNGLGFIEFGLGRNSTKFSGWFGSLMGVKSAGVPADSRTQGWSLADWVYEANKVDISGYENTAPFIEALANATKLRDKLGSQLTCNTTSYPASSDAEGDIADLGENVLSKVEPTVYYYDGTEKTKCEIKSVSDLYDGDFNTQPVLSDYAFTDDSSYIELIYNFGGALNVEDFLVGFSDNKELAKANY
ncbi:MAG: hypothetical protein IJZ75_07330, partial [Clostridia bacterium]|nr:hypothetical protein [Clostridia bacterium]